MEINKTDDISLFISYISQKNESMPTPMWKPEQLTIEHFNELYGNYQAYLITEGNTVIGGFLLLEHDYTCWNDIENLDQAFYIHKIFVLKEYNGKGYGHKAIQEIISIGKSLNKKYIRLDCRLHNESLNRYYEQEGLQIVRTTYSPYSGEMNLRQITI